MTQNRHKEQRFQSLKEGNCKGKIYVLTNFPKRHSVVCIGGAVRTETETLNWLEVLGFEAAKEWKIEGRKTIGWKKKKKASTEWGVTTFAYNSPQILSWPWTVNVQGNSMKPAGRQQLEDWKNWTEISAVTHCRGESLDLESSQVRGTWQTLGLSIKPTEGSCFERVCPKTKNLP